MKTSIIMIVVSLLIVSAFLGACSPAGAENAAGSQVETQADTEGASVQQEEPADTGYGAKGALADDAYTLEVMLTYALQDEYLARYEYELIMDKYGEITPFVNIKEAEEKHISELLPLFEKYGIEVPEDESAEYAVMPESLLEAGETGVQAEIDNIAMYEAFLKQDIPEDVGEVFEALKKASENHLQAFERLVRRES